jgi:hypothetical protein
VRQGEVVIAAAFRTLGLNEAIKRPQGNFELPGSRLAFDLVFKIRKQCEPLDLSFCNLTAALPRVVADLFFNFFIDAIVRLLLGVME